MRFIESFRVPAPADAVFAFAGDFRNLPQWDPGITAVEKLTPGAIRKGTKFRVELRFLGLPSTMEYVVEEWEPGRRARLKGATPIATAVDTVTVEGGEGGTSVTWDADISFVFPISLADVLVAAAFRPAVQSAVEGLKRALRGLPAAG